MKHLYFCRHGLSVMNEAGLFSGQTETPLSDAGRKQAKETGERAKSLRLDAIVSSTYERALETAEIIARIIDFPPQRIIQNALFVERHLGALEGTPYIADLSGELDEIEAVETAAALQARLEKAYAFLQTLPADNILVVSHGATGRMLRHVIDPSIPFWDPDPAMRDKYKFPNAQIVQLV